MASNFAASNSTYSLSSEIHGHTGDVRAVCTFQDVEDEAVDYVLTASRDKTACIWCRTAGAQDMILVKTMSQHNGFVSAVCVIPRDESKDRHNAMVVTGGQDKVIMIHSIDPQVSDPVARYVGHTGLISSLIYQCNRLISVSWDSTMRVWNSASDSSMVKAHEPAVWCVSGLYSFDGTDRVLTGGADKAIKLWEVETKLCIQEYRGHNDVVRDVAVVSGDHFLSASNDCTIRKWNIHSAQCMFEYNGHEAFVYSISLFPGLVDDFVSSGEDGTIRVWRSGSCVQTIPLPAVSVWSVSVMNNGDIVSGSSDSVARVFTASDERMATSQQLQNFSEQVETFRTSKGTDSIDVSKLPKMSALSEPGKSTGDTKLINNNGRAEVYQWNAGTMQWEKIGDAVGQAPDSNSGGGKKTFNGKEYDYVFDIEVEDGGPNVRNLKLPFNKGGDPYEAAEKFIVSNDVPVWYLDKVAEFIIQNADVGIGSGAMSDPFTGANRYIPGGSSSSTVTASTAPDPFTGGSRYVPGQQQPQQQGQSQQPISTGADPFTGASAYTSSEPSPAPPPKNDNPYYPISAFKTFTSPANYHVKVIDKIKEFATASPSECKLSDTQLVVIQQLCSSLATPNNQIDTASLDVLRILLEWPAEYVFPILDILRIALLNEEANGYFTQPSVNLITVLHQKTCDLQPKNQLLVLRILSNILIHVSGQHWFTANIQQIVTILNALIENGQKNSQIALSTVILNFIYYSYTHKYTQSVDEFLQMSIKILQSPTQDNEVKLRALLSIGTLCSFNKPLLTGCVSVDNLVTIVAPLCDVTDDNQSVGNCALHLMEQLLA